MKTNLIDWIKTYTPNRVLVSNVSSDEVVYSQLVKAVAEQFPEIPVREFKCTRQSDNPMSANFKIEYQCAGITKEELITSDLTLVVVEKGMIVPIRTTNRSETVMEFTL